MALICKLVFLDYFSDVHISTNHVTCLNLLYIWGKLKQATGTHKNTNCISFLIRFQIHVCFVCIVLREVRDTH